jgi:lipooligosaccharide transport system ATP-binding protein
VLKERAAKLLDFVQLTDRASGKVDQLSGGMKRRLTIARALMNDPELILLDEPTTGLDPQARHLVWQRLFQLKTEGVTIVLTTHYMDEAEQLCDRLVIMDDAHIVAEGSPSELIARHATREVVELRFSSDADRQATLPLLPTTSRHHEELAERVLVYTDDGEATLAHVNADGVHPSSVLVRRSTLEDVFLLLTGRTLVD